MTRQKVVKYISPKANIAATLTCIECGGMHGSHYDLCSKATFAAATPNDWPVEHTHQHKCRICGREYLGREQSMVCFKCASVDDEITTAPSQSAPTLRTDKAMHGFVSGNGTDMWHIQCVDADFARKLERELNAANELIEHHEGQIEELTRKYLDRSGEVFTLRDKLSAILALFEGHPAWRDQVKAILK